MLEAQKDDLVQIHRVILNASQRSKTLPSSTKSVPYECWIKGFLLNETAKLGDTVKIKTFIGRELSGILSQINPTYDHNFGMAQKELLMIVCEIRNKLDKAQK